MNLYKVAMKDSKTKKKFFYYVIGNNVSEMTTNLARNINKDYVLGKVVLLGTEKMTGIFA